MSREEAARELREIALKFFRGNPLVNREGFQQAGLVTRLNELTTLLAQDEWHEDPAEQSS